MDITYDYYRIFYYVAKYGSISQAAKVLTRGQPNVTKAMQNLETQLGCKLFVRSSRGIQLTPEGEKLYLHLSVAFAHISTAEEEILAERNLETGTISIATTEVALYGAVLPALTAFSTDYPKVKIKIANSNNRHALEMLKSGLADFAVLTMRDDADGHYRVTTVQKFQELLCIQADLPFPDGLAAIDTYPYIGCSNSTYVRLFCQSYLLTQGIQKEPDIEVATSNHVLQMVKAGIGVGFVSEPLAREWLDRGAIKQIRLQPPPPEREICMVEDRGRSLSIAAKTFASYLK